MYIPIMLQKPYYYCLDYKANYLIIQQNKYIIKYKSAYDTIFFICLIHILWRCNFLSNFFAL